MTSFHATPAPVKAAYQFGPAVFGIFDTPEPVRHTFHVPTADELAYEASLASAAEDAHYDELYAAFEAQSFVDAGMAY